VTRLADLANVAGPQHVSPRGVIRPQPMIQRSAIVLVTLALSTTAHAERHWHAGLNLRGDLGTHPIRAGAGVELGRVDTTLVLDPMFWTDGLGGTQFQQKLLVGVGAPLPQLGPFRSRFSFELATVVVKHGADLPADWISFATGRDFIDLVNFGMFLTVEYARAL
jgi:hypothetical protein